MRKTTNLTGASRAVRPRQYLMCRPSHFDVTYSINPWMDPSQPTSARAGITQWEKLYQALVGLGHEVALVEPIPGLPDMVFAANGATVVDGKVLVARFRHHQRSDEAKAFITWFEENGWTDVQQAAYVNEGEGDFLYTGDSLLAGCGFRSDARAHNEAGEFFGIPVTTLTLVDSRFYHLDTALSVLAPGEIMYYPAAFDRPSRSALAERYPDAILANEADAVTFGLNALSDGHNVVLSPKATGLAEQLRGRGYNPISVAMPELLKGGGGIKCCTLELRR